MWQYCEKRESKLHSLSCISLIWVVTLMENIGRNLSVVSGVQLKFVIEIFQWNLSLKFVIEICHWNFSVRFFSGEVCAGELWCNYSCRCISIPTIGYKTCGLHLYLINVNKSKDFPYYILLYACMELKCKIPRTIQISSIFSFHFSFATTKLVFSAGVTRHTEAVFDYEKMRICKSQPPVPQNIQDLLP